jgi:hypothetical protein
VSKVDLRLDWVGHDAAKFAVEHWHYSRSMPTPPVIKIGVWEDGKFIGCVLFSRGATNNLGKPYGLTNTEVCELTRVALTVHHSAVSRILAIAIKMLAQKEDGLRLIVSFADTEQQHHGGIYQASNWLYSGMTAGYDKFRDKSGRIWHPRQVSATGYKRQYGDYRRVPKINDWERVPVGGKHRYLYPLDDDMRRQIEPLRKPYPKRLPANEAIQDAPGDQSGMGGASPTRSL